MTKRARTPIIEYEGYFAIELPGDQPPQERDRLTDQALVIAYDRRPGQRSRWRLRALFFDRDAWTRSGIREWWAAHEVQFLAQDQQDKPVPEICRAYHAPNQTLPTIVLCHRNTLMVPAQQQIDSLDRKQRGKH
jgi:hypothetical protein